LVNAGAAGGKPISTLTSISAPLLAVLRHVVFKPRLLHGMQIVI